MTHSACATRLKNDGGKALCCSCYPHTDCDDVTPPKGFKVKVAGEPAAIRIMRQLDNRIYNEPMPTMMQVAMVLDALADHTAIMYSLHHDRMGREMQGEDPTKETSFWPDATSVGRYFQDVARDIELNVGRV